MNDDWSAFLARKAEAHELADRKRRPDGVTLMALLALSSLLFAWIGKPTPIVAALGPVGIVGTLLLSVVLGAGLLGLRPWARPLGIVLWSLAFVDALLLVMQGTINTSLIVGPLAVWYLDQPEIKRVFGQGSPPIVQTPAQGGRRRRRVGWGRLALIGAIVVLVVDLVVQSWINGHTVDLVVVNASGTPVEISWQPAPGQPPISNVDPGCGSHSLSLSRGTLWSVARDGNTVLDSSTAGLPLLDSMVEVEVWLDRDGSVRIEPPRAVARSVDAPYPNCQNGSS